MSTAYQQPQPWLPQHAPHMQSPFHEPSNGMQQQQWPPMQVSMAGYGQMPHPTHHNHNQLQPHQTHNQSHHNQASLPPIAYNMAQSMHQAISQAPSQSLRPASSQSSLHSVPPSPGLPMSQAPSMSHVMTSTMHHIPPPISMASMPSSMAMALPSPMPSYRAQGQPPIPHQVVGQQGIRGVLPRSTGENSSAEELCDAEQGPDGYWKCKLCGKSYRHAKHLRRHHARHTGETPYECTLCCRRFGRSDVLKRHYHKCASRRGVEIGDHLAGQRGHPRRRTGRAQSGDNNSQDHGSPVSDGQV